MNILFLVSSMTGGGAERVAAVLCNQWAKEGHSVTLVPTYSGGGGCDYELDTNVNLVYLANQAKKNNKLTRFVSLRRIIKHNNPDVIYSFLTHVNIVAILVSYGLNIPVVVSERIYPPSSYRSKKMLAACRLLYPYAHKVVMQTDKGAKWMKGFTPRSNVTVIANPVKYPMENSLVEDEASYGDIIAKDRFAFLAVGRLEKQKGFGDLITAFSIIADEIPDWDLVILGEGTQRQALEKEAERKEIQERVFLPGRLKSLDSWYKQASIYIMSSYYEGFPNSLLEAMTYGLAVISRDCDTGPRDLITDSYNGFLVPVDSIDELANKMLNLAKDEDKRHEYSTKAKVVRDTYSIDKIASKWLSEACNA
ncbi:glycosyltransferase family 4 protein [Cobetia amphilecti]|uniref:Glycosyltransferase family 4 protein n=1 Tax=Cobetia amphilecti TaxID=1055104 RepID=A0AAP4WUB4_9GAMM|nr:glycosyltransferase family 4 protein [Cobetia amphilecti]MDO6670835.1 glycosyltransferase family 4 protein [Cobetia amphilecti]